MDREDKENIELGNIACNDEELQDSLHESEDKQDILDALDKEFGQEELYMWSTYILPNGHFLNPDKNIEYFRQNGFNGGPAYEHCDFEDWANDNGYGRDLSLIYDNCIKMNVTYPYLSMPDKARPTQEQFNAIRKILDRKDLFEPEGSFYWYDIFPEEKVDSKGENLLAIYTPKGDELFDLDVSDADDIIRAINQAYIRGGFFNESLNEEKLSTENFDVFVTTSVYEAKNKLLASNEPMRLFIDEKQSLYLIGYAYECTHMQMVNLAHKNGYDVKLDDYDTNSVCVVYSPKDEYNNPDFTDNDAVEDYYAYSYWWDDFVFYSRYQPLSKFKLYNVLKDEFGKPSFMRLFRESLNEAKGGDTFIYNGKKAWSGAVSTLDGTIEEVHSYKEAEEVGFHHTFYFSDSQLDKMDEGDSCFFCIYNDGTIMVNATNRFNSRGDDIELNEDFLKKRIKEQVKLINKESLTEEKEDIISFVEKNIGTSDRPIDGPSYIMPDGKFLTIWKSKIPVSKYSASGSATHRDVQQFLYDNGLAKDDFWQVEDPDLEQAGCVRVNGGFEEYIWLPDNRPNETQWQSLLMWLDWYFRFHSKLTVGYYHYAPKTYYAKDYTTDEILKKCKEAYARGYLTEDYKDDFISRTTQHIARVNKYANKINKSYPNHDSDKFNELFDGYSLMNKKDVSEEEQQMIDDATYKHVINNEHHPEHWCNSADVEGFSRKNPNPHGCLDCSKMSESAMEEMCCDWCAMSEEFNNTPFEWFDKVKDTRWHFNEEQEKFILDTLHKLWDEK